MTLQADALSSGDWAHSGQYDGLRRADRNAFAWEWLRRTEKYREAWRRYRSRRLPDPRRFGLERFEDPALPVPVARPVWSAQIDPTVIRATVLDPFARSADRIDLWRLLPYVSVAIDDDQIEHLLLSDGIHSLRIDIVEGSLIGNPASLQYGLHGIASLHGPMPTLQRLIGVVESGRFDVLPVGPGRRDRWILELRVADALIAGAGHQEIARGLFASNIADTRWRAHNPSLRQRVHRLVKAARANLAKPLDKRWFVESSGPARARKASGR